MGIVIFCITSSFLFLTPVEATTCIGLGLKLRIEQALDRPTNAGVSLRDFEDLGPLGGFDNGHRLPFVERDLAICGKQLIPHLDI